MIRSGARSRPLCLVLLAALLAGLFASLAAADPEVVPGEVQGLQWCNPLKTCLQWLPVPGATRYRLHRGEFASTPCVLNPAYDACDRGIFMVPATSTSITEIPTAGISFWYLVIAENASGAGSAGSGTAGPRTVNDVPGPCAPFCMPAGAHCIEARDCCSANCLQGICQAVCCRPTGLQCIQNADCCTGACAGGVCQPQCLLPFDCPGTDTVCRVRTCSAGMCGVSNAPAGPIAGQTPGNCQREECDGQGNLVGINDDTDLPNDGSQCTSDQCAGGVPSNSPLPLDTPCSQNGGIVCNASGSCVECNAASQCPGTGTFCQPRACASGACGYSNTTAGTPTPAQTPGDCHQGRCDGVGGETNAVDDSDVPVDGIQCTNDVCTAGTPGNPPAPLNTPCNQNGGSVCSANGTCVQCNSASQCPGTDTACQVRTCTASVCGFSYVSAGTPVPGQNPGDCHQLQCDGFGGTTSVIDNSDVPVDGNDCTSDLCTAGTPSNPPVALNTPCNQNGGSFCDPSGTCVQCNAAAQCPGTDTFCQTRSCTSSTCGFSNTAAGTPTPDQTPGDCRQRRCNGSGGTQNFPDNTDVPVDGNECTQDVCLSGIPFNQPTTIMTPCSQNGGNVCDGSGACVVAPTVVSTTPAAGTIAAAGTAISVTFSQAMNPNSLTGQNSAGACAGSIQVSLDGFASCVAFSSVLATMSGGNTIATFQPQPGLLVNRTFQIRVTTDAQTATGLSLVTAFTQSPGFATSAPNLCDGSLVISQIYGGGGFTGAFYRNDFVEIHNRGTSAVSVAAMSVQYAAATGSSWGKTNLTGSIAPGGYYLVQLASDGAGGVLLPTPDATGTTNMSVANGKLALVSNQTALAGTCPTGGGILDFVGWGTANCSEGTGTAPSHSNTTTLLRNQGGCADLGANATDLASGAPNARNTASTPVVCQCVAQNESGLASEADFCNVEFPGSMNVQAGTTTPTVFGQVFETGVTSSAGASSLVRAQLGYGPPTANPEYQAGWSWTNASFNIQLGNNDEYMASFTAPAAGSYRYAYRFSLDQGVSWTFCDTSGVDGGSGSNGGLTFDLENLGVLTTTP